jgi:polyhydroxybutyrate depolymerase
MVALAHGADHKIEITSGGKVRHALLYLPTNAANASAPAKVSLIVNLHTLAEDGKKEEDLTGMSALAEKEGFVVVYPDGLLDGNLNPLFPLGVGKSWNGGTCCPKSCAEKVDDVQFVTDLVASLTAAVSPVSTLTNGSLLIDPARVYGCGASNGAFMMNRLGCQAPSLFAAIAPLSGPIGNGHIAPWGTSKVWRGDDYDCPKPARPLPTLYFHGTADPLVPWNGSAADGFPSVASYLALRKSLNGIANGTQGAVTFRNKTVECTSYSADAAGDGAGAGAGGAGSVAPVKAPPGASASNVTFCKHESGHCWPGSTKQGKCTVDIDATAQIWQFFQQYTRQ